MADAVVIANVFHFLNSKHAIKALENVQKILKPHGRLFIMNQTPHFVMHAQLKNLKEIEEVISDGRARVEELKRQMIAKMQKNARSAALSMPADAEELQELVDEIEADKRDANDVRNSIYSPSCYCELFKIYSEQRFPLPGYITKSSIHGLCFPRDGASKPHSALEKPCLLVFTAELLTNLVMPFGFEALNSKEYIMYSNRTEECEQGSSVAVIFIKTGEGSALEIWKLRQQAEEADDIRKDFRQKFPVKYTQDFPFLKLVAQCWGSDCHKPGNKICGKCKKAAYCSRECQRKDWSVHKTKCNK